MESVSTEVCLQKFVNKGLRVTTARNGMISSSPFSHGAQVQLLRFYYLATSERPEGSGRVIKILSRIAPHHEPLCPMLDFFRYQLVVLSIVHFGSIIYSPTPGEASS